MKCSTTIKQSLLFTLFLYSDSPRPVSSWSQQLSDISWTNVAAPCKNNGFSPSRRLNISPLALYAESDDRIRSSYEHAIQFGSKHFFLLGMFVAVGLARLAPSLGVNGGALRPEISIGNFGVSFIFLCSGLSLDPSELLKAISNLRLNLIVQATTFGLWPFLIGLPIARAVGTHAPTSIPKTLLDGILILTCLPTTVNMCVILTSSAGGNVAAALSNAVISNLAGIAITPALLFRFFGQSIQLSLTSMIGKLCSKVLLPVVVGQLLRQTRVKQKCVDNSKLIKRSQEIVLLSILWNAFCNAFSQSIGLKLQHLLKLLLLLPLLHMASLATLFKSFKALGFPSGDVVAGMFVASQKTLAFGLPLINTIFDGSPNLASYCAPIMIMHPIQLLIGSMLLPKLQQYLREEKDVSG